MDDVRSACGFILAVGVAASLLGMGCSTTIGTNPNAYPFRSNEVFELRPGVAVAVSDAYPAEKRVELASRVFCDLRHFTATAAAMVTREFERRGAAVAPASGKTITSRMTHPSWIQGSWTMKGRVTLEAELGNGQKLEFEGESQTTGAAYLNAVDATSS